MQIEGYVSPVTKETTFARTTTRFRTFPDHLLIQLKKFDIDEKWQPYKVYIYIVDWLISYKYNPLCRAINLHIYFQLDVEVDMPDEIDIGCLLKASGI